jgi:NTP pyrophosphatase (non-canonical NTP hydrolase)
MSYRDEVLRLCNKELNQEEKLINGAMGLAGEAGEVVDLIKKFKFHKKPFDREKLLNEMGDVRWYLELLTIAVGTTMEEVEALNTKKLNVRFPNGFTAEDAELRRDVESTKG